MECDECQRGIHNHMQSMKLEFYGGLSKHDIIEVLDCKNLVDDGQCVCHLWVELKNRLLYGDASMEADKS